MTKSKKAESLSFEEAMQELEGLVKQMEEGELALEDSLKAFERGVQLARHSQQTLKQAEQKVKILMDQQGQEMLLDFDQADTE